MVKRQTSKPIVAGILPLTGSILSILPFSLLGIIATILVALSRDEFGNT